MMNKVETGDVRPLKKWRYHPEQCDICGDGSEILTEATDPGYGYDGDLMRCRGCGAVGQWTVHGEGDAYADWDVIEGWER